MQPNTLTRREYKGKIYVKNIRKKSCSIRNQLPDTDPKKNPSGSTHCSLVQSKDFSRLAASIGTIAVSIGTEVQISATVLPPGLVIRN